MDSKAMFRYCAGCDPDRLPEKVIVTPFLPERLFTAHCSRVRSFKGRLYSGAIARKGDVDLAVIRCGMGDRLMGDAVLMMDDTAVRDIVFAGACGGLKDRGIGDIVLCENAFNGEGFTRYHTPSFDMEGILEKGDVVPADPGILSQLGDFFSRKNYPDLNVRAGDVFTIGSLMAEKPGLIDAIERKGFTGVELELSAVYQAARAIGRRAAGLLLVSDLPLTRPLWEKAGAAEEAALRKSAKVLARACVEFISEM